MFSTLACAGPARQFTEDSVRAQAFGRISYGNFLFKIIDVSVKFRGFSMKRTAWLLVFAGIAVASLTACGGASSDTKQEEGAAAPVAGGVQITPAAPRASGGETGQRVRPPSELDITIDSCTWEPEEPGGPIGLKVSFTVVNNAPENLFATFLIRDQINPGLFYKPPGSKSALPVETKQTDSRSLFTDKFPVGSETLNLVIAGQRRTTENIPLENCTQP